jgi:hypothetical protein
VKRLNLAIVGWHERAGLLIVSRRVRWPDTTKVRRSDRSAGLVGSAAPHAIDGQVAKTFIELPAWMTEQLSQASPDLLRQMVQIFADALVVWPWAH